MNDRKNLTAARRWLDFEELEASADRFDALVGVPSGPQSVLAQAARTGGPGYDVTASVDLPALARFVTATDTASVVTARIEPGQNQTPATVAGGGFAFDAMARAEGRGWAVEVAAQDVGTVTVTTLPGGETTWIGRKQPEFFGMVGSVTCSMSL